MEVLETSAMESAIFCGMKEGCKVVCVEIITHLIFVLRKVLIFDILEYGAAYGPEYSA